MKPSQSDLRDAVVDFFWDRFRDGAIVLFIDKSEAGIRAHCEACNMTILAIHSIEVEE